MSDAPDDPSPPPGIASAVLLTGLAWSAAVLVSGLVASWTGVTVALAIGMVLGFGGVGTVAARQIPDAEAQLGLRAFAPRVIPALLLLLPAVVVASEVDNIVAAFLPRAPEDPADLADAATLPFVVLENVITVVLLRPVVEEFFFRGVLQQRLVARYGSALGVAAGALLFALARGSFALPAGAPIAASFFGQALFLGAILGVVRHRTDSLLAAILTHVGIGATGFLAAGYTDALPIPGFNMPGAHTPFAILAACTIAVALGLALLGERSGDGVD